MFNYFLHIQDLNLTPLLIGQLYFLCDSFQTSSVPQTLLSVVFTPLPVTNQLGVKPN